jgi:hypothetical protein
VSLAASSQLGAEIMACEDQRTEERIDKFGDSRHIRTVT